jgi:VanZ family protein
LGRLAPVAFRAATACPYAGRPERGAGYTDYVCDFKPSGGEPGYAWAMIQHLRLPAWYRQFARWVFLPALAVVVWGELKPSAQGPEGWDKLLHFTAYFGLAGIATVALGRPRPAAWAAAGLASFGGILEVVQSFVGRDAEWLDEAANVLGVCAGLGAGLLTVHLMARLSNCRAVRRGEHGTVR